MSDLLAKIQAADKLDLKQVEVPEWKMTVYIKQLTAGARDSLDSQMYELKNEGGNPLDNMRSRFLACVLCDENGTLLVKPSEFEKLAGLSAKPLERIFEAAQEHCKLNADAVEDAAKN